MSAEIFEYEPVNNMPEGLSLVPATLPKRLPTKHEITFMRAELLEQFTGQHGYLRAFLIVKLIDKLVSDDDEGVIKLLHSHAIAKFMEEYPNQKTAEVNGVTVTLVNRTRWKYPQVIVDFEAEVKKLTDELKGMKKAAEADGRATKEPDFGQSLSVKF